MLTEKEKILIERFLDENLSPDEQQEFNASLNNPKFRQMVNIQQTVIATIEARHREKLRDELIGLKDAGYRSGKQVWLLYGIAASLVLLVVAAILLSRKSSSTPESVFLSYYVPYRVENNVRGQENVGGAFRTYTEGNYKDAVVQFLKSREKATDENERSYYALLIGNCYLSLNDPKKAIVFLDEASHSSDSIIVQEAQWYKALALVAIKKLLEADTIFSDIINSKSIYAEQARRMRSEIENIHSPPHEKK